MTGFGQGLEAVQLYQSGMDDWVETLTVVRFKGRIYHRLIKYNFENEFKVTIN
jgi:hypothetical protein